MSILTDRVENSAGSVALFSKAFCDWCGETRFHGVKG